ncbi:MAG: thioredoxin family protein [Anaerolineae bacterium]|nr:thioredoxin family protein [Anaerolineae bacterium]
MVKLEVFSGDPPCPGCVALVELAQKVAAKYEGELELTVLKGAEAMEKFEQYKLFCVPAAVVNGSIRIEGMCPSEATLNNAFREGGLCLK